MTANILPVSNIINVSVTTTPSGLTTKNVNSLALFTQDSPINSEVFGVYISPSQVAANYGTNSVTAEMANNVFAQLPNPLSGGGRLVIIPMLAAVSATSGHMATANLSANLAAIIAVTSGDIDFKIDGQDNNLKGIDFTDCVTWADVAALLQSYLTTCDVAATANGFTVTSRKVGSTSTSVMQAVSGGTNTNMAGSGLFNAAGSTPTAGANSSGETVLACLARTGGLVGYVPIMATVNLEDAAISAIAAGIQAADNLFFQHFGSTEDVAGEITTISQAAQTKTRCLLYTTGQSDANLYKAAYAGRALSTDFTGSLTATTMQLKSLANVDPDPGMTQTLYDAALLAGADIYVSFDGVPSVVSSGGNDYFDNPYSDLALKFALESAGFNYLRTTNTKVPQTEQGMTGLKNAYRQVMDQFVTNGELAPGTWNSSEYFGDPTIFANNIINNGYYIYSAPIAIQSVSDRNNRKAPLCQIAAKRAGAIQTSSVLVIVNN